jgi:hypothetical protein
MRCSPQHEHRHFYRFLVNLDKCAAARCHVTVDSREHSDISGNEHRAVKVASHAPLTPGRADAETTTCRDAACWQRVAPFWRRQSCRKLILFDRCVPVDTHGAGGGRNWADPITRHRNSGCSSEGVAHFLCSVHDSLRLCRAHYVFARISTKCRCAKCEREHDTRASNRRTAQATKPVFYPHAVIMIPFRISRKRVIVSYVFNW